MQRPRLTPNSIPNDYFIFFRPLQDEPGGPTGIQRIRQMLKIAGGSLRLRCVQVALDFREEASGPDPAVADIEIELPTAPLAAEDDEADHDRPD